MYESVLVYFGLLVLRCLFPGVSLSIIYLSAAILAQVLALGVASFVLPALPTRTQGWQVLAQGLVACAGVGPPVAKRKNSFCVNDCARMPLWRSSWLFGQRS